MLDEKEIRECPACGGLWFKGECYRCGATIDAAGKLVPGQPDGHQPPPEPVPRAEVEPQPESQGFDL